ncbi:MAG: aminotransferase class V-fold PLP-dependent enzyme [Firmicutes bacterium]|nr:aminotransferase class V-fold PLP-dependent enzyme [Bacillota bacterium]
MINFTVGPVQSPKSVREIAHRQVPYFRNNSFSQVMWENAKLIKNFAKASEKDKAIFMTGSGTLSMEATIINIFNEHDKVIIVNGGSFGQRFVDICNIHNIVNEQIKLENGHTITEKDLEKVSVVGCTGFVVNMHETSTGVLYDMKLISEFCRKNNLLLIVDSISSFLADEIDFKELNIDALIIGSQKSLACDPGVSIIILSERAINIINSNKTTNYYMNLKAALKDAERGQTPFTPAVSILLEINQRLKDIESNGGVENQIAMTKQLADYFRKKISSLNLKIYSDKLSNAVTPIIAPKNNAHEIFEILEKEYNIWICPNGGELRDKIFRVGHIGDLTIQEYDKLLVAFEDLRKRNIL